jgi:hypothetical protein
MCVCVCAQYSDFLDRSQLRTQKLLKQGYVSPRLRSSLHKFYGRHHNLVDRYAISISKMTMDLLLLRRCSFSLSLPRLLPNLIVYMSNTEGVLLEARTAYPSPAPAFIPGILVGSVLVIFLVFCIVLLYIFYILSSVTISA